MTTDPFAVLGLPARPDLTDDEVRAAWRRLAAATHPDRDDGGDPQAFAAAAAAYTDLRTQTGRREALADPPLPRRRGRGRVRRGRPAILAVRLAVAATVSLAAFLAAGAQPATYAVIAAALTWLIRTARRELAPRGRTGAG
ncbi:MAG TPA: DnaJ domain-containing protein [Streptosporangiaceae bacterium]